MNHSKVPSPLAGEGTHEDVRYSEDVYAIPLARTSCAEHSRRALRNKSRCSPGSAGGSPAGTKAVRTMRASRPRSQARRRARCAPRQKWGPGPPKPRCSGPRALRGRTPDARGAASQTPLRAPRAGASRTPRHRGEPHRRSSAIAAPYGPSVSQRVCGGARNHDDASGEDAAGAGAIRYRTPVAVTPPYPPGFLARYCWWESSAQWNSGASTISVVILPNPAADSAR